MFIEDRITQHVSFVEVSPTPLVVQPIFVANDEPHASVVPQTVHLHYAGRKSDEHQTADPLEMIAGLGGRDGENFGDIPIQDEPPAI